MKDKFRVQSHRMFLRICVSLLDFFFIISEIIRKQIRVVGSTTLMKDDLFRIQCKMKLMCLK